MIILKMVGKMKYYIFLDDSGQLHPKYPHGDYFVYGGLLVKENDFHKVNTGYKKLVNIIKKEQNIQGELRSSIMNNSTEEGYLRVYRNFQANKFL